jgi:Sec-independent protein translocase protein TatA
MKKLTPAMRSLMSAVEDLRAVGAMSDEAAAIIKQKAEEAPDNVAGSSEPESATSKIRSPEEFESYIKGLVGGRDRD